MERKPLVSVIIATHNRAELLTTRAIPSVLNQTYQNFELIIVADRCTDDTRDRVQAIKDPRIKFVELTDRPPLPDDLHTRWRVASAAPRNKGLEIATGEWLTFLDDDDEFTPDHIELLLNKALEGYDFVYGNMLMITPSGERRVIGKYPPKHGHIGTSSFICSAKYKHIKFNTDATATWEPGDWNFIRRVIEAGAKVYYINKIVYIHYLPVRAWEKQQQKLPWTGERFLPWIPGAQIHYEHLHRYAFASQFVKGKKVLDLACGEGYGANMLAREAECVVGIDIDGNVVEHARAKYTRGNLEFIQGSILAIPIEGEKLFDVITCFEAIEHVAEHDKLLSEVKRLLKEDGIFIVSTPNKAVYSDAPTFHNPFHVKELYFSQFEELLKRYFKHLQMWGQQVYAGSNIWELPPQERSTSREFLVRKGDFEFHIPESSLGGKKPTYFFAMASDAPLSPSQYHLDSWLVDVSNTLLSDYERQIAQLNASLQDKEAHIAQLNASLQEKEAQLQQIQQGIVMQLVSRYQRLIEKLLPGGTRRRYYYELALTGIRVLLNEGWRSFWRKFQIWLQLKRSASKLPAPRLPRFKSSFSRSDIKGLTLPPPARDPEVSIIIPVYNHLIYTLNCLKAVIENTQGNYEVIVVDDGSTDDTYKVLSKIKNLRLLRNKRNLGFVDSCNRGAKEARGKYLLFLNNDTMVSKGWLQPMVELIKRTEVGAVGSKLVYPDGKLQEAGAIIWKDGTGWNYGRGDDPSRPEYNYVREVDYCSGASLMVKKELFDKIGGFDQRFCPGYGEDADLCFTIRELGYKVMYQPLSIVVHAEGVTCGTDVSSGVKRYQEVNRVQFVQKWGVLLRDRHHEPSFENAFLARDRTACRRVLVICHYIPTYDQDAGSLWVFNILRIICELGHKVTFIGDNLLKLEPYASTLQQTGVEVVYYPYTDSVEKYLSKFAKYFDIVFLSRTHIAAKYIDILKGVRPKPYLVYLTHELTSLSELRRYEIEHDQKALERARISKQKEVYVAANCDCTVAVSPVEKQKLLNAIPNLNVEIVSSIYDVVPPQKPFSERRDIMFLGGFNHPPNVDSVLYLVQDIFPLIAATLPDVCLYIVGSNPPREVLSLASSNIKVTGLVPELTPYFESSRVFIAPLRYGAGVKGKIVQSMAHGLPVVTTSIGAEGMNLVNGQTALIADTPQEFAAQVIRVYNDEELWYGLSINSIKYVQANYSREVAKNTIQRIIANATCRTRVTE